MIFSNTIRDDDCLRASFVVLAKKVFGLDFEPWYAAGYWQDAYIPHVLAVGDRVVANVSVNLINTRWQGKSRRYLQIGTVMTDPEYRGKGLIRQLMEKVFLLWAGHYDAMYLYANNAVIDFYPKFGFVQAQSYQCSRDIALIKTPHRRLVLDNPKDKALLLEMYRKGNPYAELPMIGNEGLLMFHCGEYLRDCLYYFEDLDALAVVDYSERGFLCYDVFSDGTQDLTTILGALAREKQQHATLGFSPQQSAGFSIEKRMEEDETLFVLSSGENPFLTEPLMFPLLSHA